MTRTKERDEKYHHIVVHVKISEELPLVVGKIKVRECKKTEIRWPEQVARAAVFHPM